MSISNDRNGFFGNDRGQLITPFNRNVIPHSGYINPMPTVPAEQFGRSIDSLPQSQPSGGGGGGTIPPLYLVKVDSTHLKVMFGQVNGITPSNGWAGGGDDVGVSVDISGYSDGTYNVYMNCTLGSDGIPTDVEVDADISPVPSDTDSSAYRLIGTAVIASGVTATPSPSMAWSQEFITCGRDSSDPSTTPGTYFWNVA